MFGITEFSAIINPPQCGILAVGGGQPYIGTFFKIINLALIFLEKNRNALVEANISDLDPEN